jgi:hypothetical protein
MERIGSVTLQLGTAEIFELEYGTSMSANTTEASAVGTLSSIDWLVFCTTSSE